MANLETVKTYGLFDDPANARLIRELAATGAQVLVFPSVRPAPVALDETMRLRLAAPADYDWLIVADIHAADCYLEILREAGTDLYELDALTVCALGEAVADRFRFVQVHADVIPPRISDEAVAAAIAQYVGGDFEGLKFLLIGAANGAYAFAEELRARGAELSAVAVYRPEPTAAGAELARFKALAGGGAVDEFVFAAPGDLLSLARLVGGDPAAALAETRVSAASEIVFQTLQEAGLRPLYFHQR